MSFVEEFKTIVGKVGEDNPKAVTAGEEDHSNPWVYAGEEADAPVNPEDGDGR